jgi:hypothetical protein
MNTTTVGQLRSALDGIDDATPLLIEESGLGYVGLLESVEGPIDNGAGYHLLLVGASSEGEPRTPEQIADAVLKEHAIQPHWNRTGEQCRALLIEAVKEARA